jgi:hypothetical protein
MTVPALAQFARTPAMAATAATASPMAKYPRSGVFGSIDAGDFLFLNHQQRADIPVRHQLDGVEHGASGAMV